MKTVNLRLSGVHFHLLIETPEHWPLISAAVPPHFKTCSFQGSGGWVCLPTLAPEASLLPSRGASFVAPLSEL